MGIVGNLGIMEMTLHPRRVGGKKMGVPGWGRPFFYDNVELFAYRDVGVHIL